MMPVSDIASFRRYIEAALEYAGGTHTFEDVRDLVAKGRLQFWPGVDSVIISEILEYPRKRVLNFFLGAGNLAELERMYPIVEEWGKTKGCTAGVVTGRKGWERSFLTRGGWKPTLAVLEKDL